MEEENKNNEETEERQIEVMEFNLLDEEIDELIMKLKLLKDTKEHIHFDVDDYNEFIIRHNDEGKEDTEEVHSHDEDEFEGGEL